MKKYQGNLCGVMFWLSVAVTSVTVLGMGVATVRTGYDGGLGMVAWLAWCVLWCAIWRMGDLGSQAKWYHRQKLEEGLQRIAESAQREDADKGD